MGKKSSSPPNVEEAAEREGQYSRLTARDKTYADRPDQNSALMNVRWGTESVLDPSYDTSLKEGQEGYDPGGGMVTKWTQNNNLSAPLQGMVDQGMMRSQAAMAEDPNFDQFGGPIGFDPTQQRQMAEDNAYQKSANRLNTRFGDQREQTDIRLRNQGLKPGDQSYDSQMDTFNTGRNDAYEQARLGATAAGRDEYGIALQGNKRANALRDQQIQEHIAKRGFGLSEVAQVNDLVRGSQT